MSHSIHKIWIHGIWSTKNRFPFISPGIENQVYGFLQDEFKEQECTVRVINGIPDHIHVLFQLNPLKAASQVIKHVKGSSSHSINDQNLVIEKFCWQTGFAAYSVSESQLKKVYDYIRLQKEYHKKKSFLQEYKELAALHGIPNLAINDI
jgi:REP element-mobilizing transposase RayT